MRGCGAWQRHLPFDVDGNTATGGHGVRLENSRCMMRVRAMLGVAVCLAVATVALVSADASGASVQSRPAHHHDASGSIRRINHVVVLMQENRSYDSYFSRLHFEGQPASSVESNKPNPNPLGGP